MTETLKGKTAKGLFWGAVNSSTTQVLNLFIGIFLARLLTPADYGIVGVLTIFTAIAGNIQDSGFSQGLINIKKPTVNDYNSVFWFNIITSAAMYVILFCCSPLIAKFFNEPRLVVLSRVVFISFFVSSLSIASGAYLKKNMMNREITISSIVALIGSGIIGVTLALNGFAYWSLVWQQLSYISFVTLCRFYYSPLLVNFHIDFGPVRKMFNFSVKILATNIINTISQNILTFIFGRLYSMKTVGNFSQAYKWDNMASSLISNTINQVAQPVMVSIKEEQNREAQVFRKMMRFVAFLSFPAMFGLALISQEFIVLAIGRKWMDSVIILQILCLSGAFLPFYVLYQNLAISNGRSDIFLWCNVGQIVFQIAIIVAFHGFGMTTMVTAYSAFQILWLFVWQRVSYKLVGVEFIDTLKDIMPFCLAAIITMVITYFLTFAIENSLLLLVSRIVLAAVIYFVIMKLLHVIILDECLEFIRKRKNKN